jgi:hypothetical protein
MDAITLATVTSAVVNLAIEAGKETLPGVLKDTWAEVKRRLGFASDPAPEDLAPRVAKRIEADEALAQQILTEIRNLAKNLSASTDATTVRLLGGVHVTNGQIQVNVTIHGDQHNKFGAAPRKTTRG